MKKYSKYLIIVTLVLAALACNLPYQNPSAEVPVMVEPADGFRVENRIDGQKAIQISVPDSYYVGDSGSELSSLIDSIDISDGPVSDNLQDLVIGSQEDILLWGYDAGSSAEIPTSFVVVKNEDYAAIPLGLISTFAGPMLGNNVTILEETRLNIAGRDTLRWITLTREAGYELTQAVYIFKQSGILYLVGFNADQQEVYGQLATYDAIVASLTFEDLN